MHEVLMQLVFDVTEDFDFQKKRLCPRQCRLDKLKNDWHTNTRLPSERDSVKVLKNDGNKVLNNKFIGYLISSEKLISILM